MKYPKQIMRKNEMIGIGIPEEMLMMAYNEKGQTFAQKINPYKKNSPIIFDTEEFEKWRLKLLRTEQKSKDLLGLMP